MILDDDTNREIWEEIELRAKNNYGPYNNEEEARDRIYAAITEIFNELADSFIKAEGEKSKIVADMIQNDRVKQFRSNSS